MTYLILVFLLSHPMEEQVIKEVSSMESCLKLKQEYEEKKYPRLVRDGAFAFRCQSEI